MYCGRCGAYNDDSHAFCENCGNRLAGAPVQQTPVPSERDAGRNRLLILIITGIILLIMVLGGIFWVHISDEKEYQEEITLGDQYLDEKNYEKAESSYRKAITISPGHPRPYIRLAAVYIETEEYNLAVEVLNQGIEAVKEENVQILQEQLTVIEEAYIRQDSGENAGREQTENGEDAAADAVATAQQVLSLPYLADRTYEMWYEKTEQGIECSYITDAGILSADLFDYDRDGQDEILAIIIGTNSSQYSNQGYWLNMLEQETDGSWTKAAEYLIDMEYHSLDSICFPIRIDFFSKEYEKDTVIFYESGGRATYFADGSFWSMGRVQYHDQTFQRVGEDMKIAGSDDVADACLRLDKNYSGPEEGRQYVLNFIAEVEEAGLDIDGIGYQYPAMDQDISLRKILRTDKTSNITGEQAEALYAAETGEQLSGATVKFTDYRKRQEEDSEQEYSMQVKTLDGSQDIWYPVFSPSSPSADAWNTYFQDSASELKSYLKDMQEEGIENASVSRDVEVTFQNGAYVSMHFTDWYYSGGAHGMYNEYGMTIDLASDHVYTLEELLNTDHASAVNMVNNAFNEDMKVHPELYFEGTQCQVSDEFSEVGYYRTEEGVVLRAQLYWLGPFAAGSQEVVLTPAENP
ncbi:DUF4163 domain-containing protein [Ruminococcus sp. OA3]|uniref:tetratricopeptide repeat protein n=1 Tax=Ruminococcus sp. OA3 TaxID=2914164 RepID=UPI001F055296|nr:tetratricopeptide repeat protein [Ruminococcus sp. OA3]MCH1982999.1 DUF4163 domain-containing protein [Ruminococcus sp. OA3]